MADDLEKQLMIARSNASVANQLVEKLATENGELKRRAAAVENAEREIATLRARITQLELELTLAKSGNSGTQAPGVA